MNVDTEQILNALGGGATAVMVLGLGWALWILWRRYVAVQDARIEDQKAHTVQLVETVRTLEKAIDFIERQERRG